MTLLERENPDCRPDLVQDLSLLGIQGVGSVIAAFDVNGRLNLFEHPSHADFRKNDHEVNAFKCSDDLSAIRLRVQRASVALERTN